MDNSPVFGEVMEANKLCRLDSCVPLLDVGKVKLLNDPREVMPAAILPYVSM